jgi:acetylornithine/succinyldiaminopimelate/putrescine aminotransferase
VHVSNLFGNVVGPDVAASLDRLVGDGSQAGGRVFLANSGAEANECAIKLARRWAGPGRHVVVSAYGSFHGRTLATLHATGQPTKHEAFQPLPEGFRHVAWDDLDALERALDASVVAGVLLEPIQGEGGVNAPSPGYFRGVRELCDERGVLLMLDEIQTGLARTGRWFAFQHEGIVPDVVTVAKALGNGMPIGACWARAEVAEAFKVGDHASTFGGQPLAAAAARATLGVMEEQDAPTLAAVAGARLDDGLSRLPGVVSVRGRGLLLAAQLERAVAKEVASRALSAGLVVNAITDGALRLAPPLLVSPAETEEALTILGKVLAEVLADERLAEADTR